MKALKNVRIGVNWWKLYRVCRVPLLLEHMAGHMNFLPLFSSKTLLHKTRQGLLAGVVASMLFTPVSLQSSLAAGNEPVTSATVETLQDTSRLLAIGGSLTEIIYTLGEEGRLIGRDTTGTYPPEAKNLADVGYMRQLSPEGVLSINPSAILMLEGSGPPETIEVLEKASVPVVVVPDGMSHEGVLEKIRIVGKTLGVSDKAEALVAQVDADMQATEKLVQKVTKPKRVLFVLSMQGDRIQASGTGTAADNIIKMAGAINVIDSFAGYKQMTDEAVDKLAPDFILMMSGGGDHMARTAEVLKHPAIISTPAAKTKSVVSMDGLYLLGFGPRTGEAVRELTEALYPEQKD
ncbi:hemin ABC transporter substrate-binding protein [Paenochrobactrum sp. BZR 588]|uniref:heme/hemin ABC transporter substrate-binding protein n=1 Tax=unclassified Paenochrobactrum TaxID=2639760 RepID=UPI003853E43D